MLVHIFPNILNEEDLDIVIDWLYNIKDFQKSDSEIETYESIEEVKYPWEYDDGDIFLLDDFNERKRTILEYMQVSNIAVIIIYLFSIFLKITMNYQTERLEPIVISIISSNLMIYKTFTSTKQACMWHSTNSNT